MSLGLQVLSDSPFLATLGPGERSFWRFLAALFGGILAFVVMAIVAFAGSLVILVLVFGWPAPLSAPSLHEFGSRLSSLATSSGHGFGNAMQIIALALPSNLIPMFAFIGVAALAHRRRIRDLATAAPRFRWRMMLAGLVISTIVIGPFLLAGQMMDPKAGPPPLLAVSPDLGARLVYALTCVVAFTPAAIGEEILFRGWLLRQTGALIRQPLLLMAINGVLFSAAHLDFAPDAFLERALMGVGFTYMTLRLGGVEMSSGVHAANNLMIVLFLEPLTLKLTPNSGVGLGDAIVDLGLLAAYVAIAELMARWAPLRRWARADPIRPSGGAEAEHFS